MLGVGFELVMEEALVNVFVAWLSPKSRAGRSALSGSDDSSLTIGNH